jgi:hypothetical protein
MWHASIESLILVTFSHSNAYSDGTLRISASCKGCYTNSLLDRAFEYDELHCAKAFGKEEAAEKEVTCELQLFIPQSRIDIVDPP